MAGNKCGIDPPQLILKPVDHPSLSVGVEGEDWFMTSVNAVGEGEW